MNEFFCTIFVPILTGILLFMIPGRIRIVKEFISLLAVVAALYYSIVLYGQGDRIIDLANTFNVSLSVSDIAFLTDTGNIHLHVDSLSRLIVLFIGISGFLILVYSVFYNKDKIRGFYSYYLITLGASFGAALSDNFILFIIFWGMLGITLYKLIPGVDEASSASAKKALIIIGASDGIMILGIAILWKITGTLSMAEIKLPTQGALYIFTFLTLITGSFTKAGAFPFHSWVPDYTQCSPASVSAFAVRITGVWSS